MFEIVEKRRWFFLLSTLIIIPGLVAMICSIATTGLPFKLAIDFTGGTLWVLQFDKPVPPAELRAVFVSYRDPVTENGFPDTQVTTLGNANTLQVRVKPIDAAQKAQLESQIKSKFGPNVTQLEYSAIGPALGSEVTRAAALAVVFASGGILLFLTIEFRKVSHPVRFGVAAVIATVHDILVVLGLFSIFSLVLGWEADALFLTALLTVIAFSVQDTIVVFDRIRENSAKYRGEPFARIVDRSLLETLQRSLAVTLNNLFIVVALLLFGGATIKQFMGVLFFGLISGAYSSLFNAVPILVAWEERSLLGKRLPKAEVAGVTANS